MKIEQILPFAQMIMCFGAAAVYLYVKDYRRALYWLAAGTLTATVTL